MSPQSPLELPTNGVSLFHTGLSDGNIFQPRITTETTEKARNASLTSPLTELRFLMRPGPTKIQYKVANLTRLRIMLLSLG